MGFISRGVVVMHGYITGELQLKLGLIDLHFLEDFSRLLTNYGYTLGLATITRVTPELTIVPKHEVDETEIQTVDGGSGNIAIFEPVAVTTYVSPTGMTNLSGKLRETLDTSYVFDFLVVLSVIVTLPSTPVKGTIRKVIIFLSSGPAGPGIDVGGGCVVIGVVVALCTSIVGFAF